MFLGLLCWLSSDGHCLARERVHRDFAGVMPEGDDHRRSTAKHGYRLTVVFLTFSVLAQGGGGVYFPRTLFG